MKGIKKSILKATRDNVQPYTEAQAHAYADIFEHVIAAFAENNSLSYEEAYSCIAPSFVNGSEDSEEKVVVRGDIIRKPDNATAKVVSIPRNAVPEFSGMREFAKWVKSMLAEGGDVEILSTGQIARFTSGKVGDSVKRSRSKEHRNAYAALREMIRNAEYDHYEEPDERHYRSGGQDIYHSALVMGGKLYSVKLKLDVVTADQRESERRRNENTDDDVRYKDHKLIEIEIAPTRTRGAVENDGATQTVDAISKINLGILRGSVKPSGIRDQTLFQPAYHGGPHRFNRFSLDHIGSGEGGQAHGWGLYFAADRDVSEEYRENLSIEKYILGNEELKGDEAYAAAKLVEARRMSKLLVQWGNTEPDIVALAIDNAEKDAKPYGLGVSQSVRDLIQELSEQDIRVEQGQLFEVDIPENDVLLDEHKLFSEQPQKVQIALTELAERHGLSVDNDYPTIETTQSGKSFWIKHPGGWEPNGAPRFMNREKAEEWLKKHPGSFMILRDGRQIYRDLTQKLGSNRAASEALNAAGIKGITYEGERDGKCFVVFDAQAIQLLTTYYQLHQLLGEQGTALGSYRQFQIRPDKVSKGLITFFQSADISTAGHEMGHWLRQVLEMGASMKDAPQTVSQDWKTVCDYFDAPYAGSAWTRQQEEAFADTFLAYLRKGEAPTENLRKAFSRIQAWLTRLYSRLIRTEAVECSPQIKEVFDRLIASEKHHFLQKEQKFMAREQDFYKDVAEKLIDQLQKGTAPWQRPWEGGESAPYNPTTGEQYHGGNVINLLMQGYQDPRWMTFNQAKNIGAQVRKGEHGSRIIYWRFEGKQPVLDEDGNPKRDAAGKPLMEEVRLERPRPFISYVFNAEQIEGLPPLERKTPEHSWTPVEKAEELLNNSGALIEHHFQPKAYYTPSRDTITLPVKEQFKDQEGYYSTALHELGHWTGHESRLNRDIRHPFGSQRYAKEELRAEIASMMISMEIGIPNVNIENHAAYVQSWIKILREDPKEIFRASSDAGKILEYVMGVEQEQMQERRQDKKQELAKEIPSGREVEYRDLSQTKRVYLDVPYREKDQAKKLGAVFDRQHKQWYVPSGRNTDSFAAWLPKTQQAGMSRSQPQAANGLRDSKRVYLAVPYEYKERTAAKKAGALWDPIAGSWYAGPNADMERLARWLPGKQPEQIPAVDPREEFAEALRSMNFVVEGEHPVMDGKSHRISTAEDKPGQKSGFYVGHMDGRPAGYMKDNRTGEEMRWKCSGPLPSWENREKFQAACRARMQEHEAELEEQYRKAAERVQSQLGYMQAATSPLPYHTSKGIAVHSGGMVGKEGTLCLPAYDVSGKVWTVQYINADGTKRFAKESRKEGCYHPVGGMSAVRSAPAIVICEGYATACSVAESLGIAAIAAFDSGNLTSVAKALHEKFPGKPIVIAGDDDRAIKVNAGRIHAEQAAKAVGGVSIFPIFAPAETGKKEFTDFNDLAVKSSLGKDAVKRQMGPVVRQAIQAKQAELAQLRQQQQSQSQGRSL